jgi:hypothetical protein
MKTIIRQINRFQSWLKNLSAPPLKGYQHHLCHGTLLDDLTDQDLAELNNILDWNCFVVDSQGRRFGNIAWRGKRDTPQEIIDRRALQLDQEIALKDKSVLEVGCFARVTAVDARIENVVKTIVRCGFFKASPTVFKCDVEDPEAINKLNNFDVLHHVGVFYHLVDPALHLFNLLPKIGSAVLLDTHYATNEQVNDTYTNQLGSFRYRRAREGGMDEVFSGTGNHSKWLLISDITSLLRQLEFRDIKVLEDRDERNGKRVLLLAKRAHS